VKTGDVAASSKEYKLTSIKKDLQYLVKRWRLKNLGKTKVPFTS